MTGRSELQAHPGGRAANPELPIRLVAEALLVPPPAIASEHRDVAMEVQLDPDLRILDGLPRFVGEVHRVLGVEIEEGDRPHGGSTAEEKAGEKLVVGGCDVLSPEPEL